MKETKQFLRYLYNHSLIRYLLVGGTTFIIDLGTLILLHSGLKFNIAVATSVAYWLAVIYNFTLNRWWTFTASENKKLYQHAAAYSVLLGFNYLFTVIFVSLVSRYINYTIAKTTAVILQTTWTFPIYKYVIFTKK